MLSLINFEDLNVSFIYNRLKPVEFNVTLALLQTNQVLSLKEALWLRGDYTICCNEDDCDGFLDLRQLEHTGDEKTMHKVLTGKYTWKLTKLAALYQDTAMQVDEEVSTYYRLESMRQS